MLSNIYHQSSNKNQTKNHPNKSNNIKPIIVHKFGGTSVNSIDKWNIIVEIIHNNIQTNSLAILVCSAFCGVSNHLDNMITSICCGKIDDYQRQIKDFENLCIDFIKNIGIDDTDISNQITNLKNLYQGLILTQISTPALQAKIMSYGEYILTSAGYKFLIKNNIQTHYLDVGKWLKSADKDSKRYSSHAHQHFLSTTCDYSYDQKFVDYCLSLNTQAIITQGFIATDNQNRKVLLGRGGSDTSASYLASKLAAQQLIIWTDVPGIFTANPKDIPSSRLILKLNYQEAQELASSGARVLHPKCIEPLASSNIPLLIKSTDLHTLKQHTEISGQTSNNNCFFVKGICRKNDVYVLSMDSVEMWTQTGFLADLFMIFKEFNISINTISTSETNVTVTLDSSEHAINIEDLSGLITRLKKICTPKLYSNCVSICLVGSNIRSILHLLSPVLVAFEDKKVFCVSQAANDLNFSFIVEYKEADKIIRQLHDLLFSNIELGTTFGNTWNSFIENKLTPHNLSNPWWRVNRKKLLDLVEVNDDSSLCEQTPVYVYHLPTITAQAEILNSSNEISRWFYAIKANNHPAIIKLLNNQSIGFDCVSIAEIHHLKTTLKNFDPNKIIFTPNFVGIKEYQIAYDLGVHVTLDNIYPLIHHPQIFSNKKVILRIDPGQAKGHHQHVRTAGNRSKFGIHIDNLDQCIEIAKKINIEIIGLHVHLGSGITNAESWMHNALFLHNIAKSIPSVTILDLGGGLAVPEKPGDKLFSITTFEQSLARFNKAFTGYQLWAEPGRFLVAQAGVILTKVQQIKTKANKTFVGVDAGLHTLLRPSYYGSYHPIYNLTRINEPATINCDIVGPICESGDTLGYGRAMPESFEKDLFLIDNAGAYGKVMASEYNMRPIAKEYLIND